MKSFEVKKVSLSQQAEESVYTVQVLGSSPREERLSWGISQVYASLAQLVRAAEF